MRVVLVVLALGGFLTAAACGSREAPPVGEETAVAIPPPTATPTPRPLLVFIRLPRQAHQGIPYAFSIEVRRAAFPVAATVEVSLDGEPFREVVIGAQGVATLTHTFVEAGEHEVRAVARAPGASEGHAVATIRVHPRVIVYIQGMNSASHCPDGRSFATRAPQWLGPYLREPANVGGLVLRESQFVYFSYSGEWCAGGDPAVPPFADYHAGDTCAGIDEAHALRLQALVDSLAPARVTIVAHSMGGLVAAYLIASRPEWAREHIASVATFDSPLGGVGALRAGVLGAGGVFDGDCGPNAGAVGDLRDDSDVVTAAATAAQTVPFYTADATRGEGEAFGQVEAVPGSATRLEGEVAHARFAEDHSETWTRGGPEVAAKRRFVACALQLAAAACLEE